MIFKENRIFMEKKLYLLAFRLAWTDYSFEGIYIWFKGEESRESNREKKTDIFSLQLVFSAKNIQKTKMNAFPETHKTTSLECGI